MLYTLHKFKRSLVSNPGNLLIPRYTIPSWELWIRIRIRMLLGLPDQDHHYFVWIRIRILSSTSKSLRKTLISTIWWLLFDFLSMEADQNVSSKSNKQKNFKKKTYFCWYLAPATWEKAGSGSGPEPGSDSGFVNQWYGSVDPNPYQNATDPQ